MVSPGAAAAISPRSDPSPATPVSVRLVTVRVLGRVRSSNTSNPGTNERRREGTRRGACAGVRAPRNRKRNIGGSGVRERGPVAGPRIIPHRPAERPDRLGTPPMRIPRRSSLTNPEIPPYPPPARRGRTTRTGYRQGHAGPILVAFADWVVEQRPRVLP